MKAHEVVRQFENQQVRLDLPEFFVGDRVKVFIKVREGDKERLQPFQGDVIRIKQAASRSTFTVRKVSYGVGVERIFPINSPLIDRIELIQHGKVRRSKLYFLRDLRGKAARIEEKRR